MRKKQYLLLSLSILSIGVVTGAVINNPNIFSIKAEDNWWVNCDMPEAYTSIAEIVDSGSNNSTYLTRGTITSIEGNNFFIQSQNRALMVYGGSSSTGTFAIGNVVDVEGTRTTYGNLVELKTPTVTLYRENNPTPVLPLIFDATEFTSFCTSENVGRLVKITNMPKPSFSSKNVTFTVNSSTIPGYINYGTASTVASEINEKYGENTLMDFKGILSVYNTTYQLRILGADDFSECGPTLASSIEVTPKNQSIVLGSSLTFEATVLPEATSNKTVTWSISSSDESELPTFNNGVLTADKVGTFTVTATTTDGTNLSDSTTVTIVESLPKGYVVENPTLSGDVLGPLYVASDIEVPSLSFLEMVYQYGDSILFDYGDFEMLIDAGQPEDTDNVMAALGNAVEDGQLEVLIVTHPHSDHFGGLQSVSDLTNAGVNSIKYIVDFGGTYSSSYYRNYVSLRNSFVENGTTYYDIYQMIHNDTSNYPNVFKITDDCTLKFLDSGSYSQVGETISSTYANESSVCALLSYGNTRAFLCGDITGESTDSEMNPEGNIMTNYAGQGLWSSSTYNIVKANHHCSGTHGSNGDTWVNGTMPDLVIISASLVEDNRTTSGPTKSQHPNATSLKRYLAATDNVYCNMINGTITLNLYSDSNPTLNFAGRTIDYYDASGNLVSKEAERTIKFKDSVFASIMYPSL